MSETKKCKSCQEEIAINATKCKICGSFQNYLRLQNIIGFIILFLTLAISSAAIYDKLSEISSTITKKKIAKIEFDIIDVYENHIKVLIRNEGTVPAVIKSGYLTNTMEKGALMSFIIKIDEPILVKPNEYLIKSFYPYGGIPDSIKKESFFKVSDINNTFKNDNNFSCKLGLEVMQFRITQTYKTQSFKCTPNHDMLELFKVLKKRKSTE
jgi:hypothetical protein